MKLHLKSVHTVDDNLFGDILRICTLSQLSVAKAMEIHSQKRPFRWMLCNQKIGLVTFLRIAI